MGVFTMPLWKLAVCTSAGALFVSSCGMLFKRIRADGLQNQPAYMQAIRFAKKHQGVQFLLGLPVTDKRVNLMRPDDNFTEDRDVYLRIPLKGPKGRGSLYFHACCDMQNNCDVKRLEFEVTSSSALKDEEYKDKRLLVFDAEKHGSIEDKL